MLAFEQQRPSGGMRKQRLFAVACCRAAGDHMPDPRCLGAVEVAAWFAADLGDPEDIVWAFDVTHEIAEEHRRGPGELAAGLANVACEESSEMAYWAYLFFLDLPPEDERP